MQSSAGACVACLTGARCGRAMRALCAGRTAACSCCWAMRCWMLQSRTSATTTSTCLCCGTSFRCGRHAGSGRTQPAACCCLNNMGQLASAPAAPCTHTAHGTSAATCFTVSHACCTPTPARPGTVVGEQHTALTCAIAHATLPICRCLQGQAQLRRKLALRPASLDSALHKRLRDHVDKRHGSKGTKVR